MASHDRHHHNTLEITTSVSLVAQYIWPSRPGFTLATHSGMARGEQCEGQCCSNGTSPPWFSVELPNPTTDNVEVRIYGTDTSDKEDIPIKLLELYTHVIVLLILSIHVLCTQLYFSVRPRLLAELLVRRATQLRNNFRL